MLTYDVLKAACEAKPACAPEFPFGPTVLVFKVGGKMFGLLGEEGGRSSISLKCDPALAEILRETHPAVTPGYHLNKRHWITIKQDDALPDAEILKLIDHAYDLVVSGLPRKVRAGLSHDVVAERLEQRSGRGGSTDEINRIWRS